jgi:hypothetical protein
VTNQPKIALVAPAGDARSSLEDYLKKSGFEIHPCERLGASSPYAVVILVDESAGSLAVLIEALMASSPDSRVVAVTSRPRALASLVARFGERLHVFPAPVFGWELVDALRSCVSGEGVE